MKTENTIPLQNQNLNHLLSKTNRFTPFIIVGLLSILFFILFWQEKYGINYILYSLAVLGLYIYSNPKKLKQPMVLVSLLCTGASVANLLLTNSVLSLITFGISSMCFLSFFHLKGLKSIYYAIIINHENLIISINNFLVVAKKNKLELNAITVQKRKLKLIIIPIILTVVFATIYSLSNPIVADYFSEALQKATDFFSELFENFSFTPLLFFTLGIWLALLIVFFTTKSNYIGLDHKQSNNLLRTKSKGRNFKILDLIQEFRIAVLTLGSLNALLLFVNAVDVKNVWFEYQVRTAHQLSGEVHEGTYLLILSILISIGLIIFYFRGNLNFYSKNKVLKYLAYSWMAQNFVLGISTAIKCIYYIHHYGLTYKRIGVLTFLLVVFTGLILVIVKVHAKKSIHFLLRNTSLCALIVLCLLSFVNWDSQIVEYNLNQKHGNDDIRYTLSFSDSSLPVLQKYISEHPMKDRYIYYRFKNDDYYQSHLFSEIIAYRCEAFKIKQQNYSWLSWNYADYNTLKALKK